MTIDEIIKVMEFFLHKQCDLGRMKYTPYDDQSIVWEAVNTIFKEWQWYREQDLIGRDKAIKRAQSVPLNIPPLILKTKIVYGIEMLPKAEPPTRTLFEPDESHRIYNPYTKTETYLPYSGMAGICCMQQLSENR